MGGTGGEGFASACSGLHVEDGSYDVAVGEEDSDDAGPPTQVQETVIAISRVAVSEVEMASKSGKSQKK